MAYEFLHKTFSDLSLPVVVCDLKNGKQVVFMNQNARVLLNPKHNVKVLSGLASEYVELHDILAFESVDERSLFTEILYNSRTIDGYRTKLINSFEKTINVTIFGNILEVQGNEYNVLYIIENENIDSNESLAESRMLDIINVTLLRDDVMESVQTVIAMAGKYVDVSRVYIFQEISESSTANTFEWCAKGIVPAIDGLQDLKKADYNYDSIVSFGIYITDDVRMLPSRDREILEMQGIKSLAIITFYDGIKPLGYIGFDDCINYRKWTEEEIQFLQNISGLVAIFIKKINAENKLKVSQEILKTISDNSHEIIYVNDMDTYKLKFVSTALCKDLGLKEEDLIGHKCYKMIQLNRNEPCEFCPIPKISRGKNGLSDEVYVWEFTNTISQKTYLTKDSIIKWVDGDLVHIETAIDITYRKDYEEQLRIVASTDAMTGIFNREWGFTVLDEIMNTEGPVGSLVFIDLDGLKRTNDLYGHSLGDKMIFETIRIIKNHIKDYEDDFICRWGGDEFLIFMKKSVDETEKIIKNIQNDLAKYNDEATDHVTLSFSYGIVKVMPKGKETLDEIVSGADSLMYLNKMEKRNKLKKRRITDGY